MKPKYPLLWVAFLVSFMNLPLFARPVSETELSTMIRTRQREVFTRTQSAQAQPAQPSPAAPPPQGTQPVQPTQSGQSKTYELVLLHTNDHHGAIVPNNGRGGLAWRSAYIKALKAFNPQVLLIDAGDINTGTALSNMFGAEPDILAYNLMGYDAAILGNHEFDKDMDHLERQGELVAFPVITSNIKTADGDYLGVPYVVKQYDGFTVGLFGITTLRTPVIASPDPSLQFINEIDAAREMVDILRNQEQVDLVIGITHMGDVKEAPDHITSPELAAAVPGIDIIVDGHSHSLFEEPLKVDTTYIVTANEWGKYIGQGKLTVDQGKLVDFYWMPMEIAQDREITDMLEPYLTKADESLKEVVGNATDEFVIGNRLPRKVESPLGDAITDAMVWYFQTTYNQALDFAFINGGNIRTGLPAGPITREQVLTVLPFENYLYIVSLKGSDVIDLFTFIASIPQGNGGWAQVSQEVRYTIDYTQGTGILQDLTIHNEPVDPDRLYRFCTNSYLLGGGDGYRILSKAQEPFNTSLIDSWVVLEALQAVGTISPETDGRITVLGGVEE
ncbi:MAG: 5'-nucleotidase C-terminal domain-containing protein [Treponema sp.]|jgi:5'-nucleotidase/UDP-sugar diphosphatase|nr:5'-nucleotidase C-terminal domain-containing protein [Treponema sp.]